MLRPNFGEPVIAIEIEMHVLEKRFFTSNAIGRGGSQGRFSITQYEPRIGALSPDRTDCFVDAGIGTEGQRVHIARALVVFTGGSVIGGNL